MALICCINGCKNRYSPGSHIKFYRIPSGSRVFQAERRQLWLDAIQKANGSTKKLNQQSRICGAHFISGRFNTTGLNANGIIVLVNEIETLILFVPVLQEKRPLTTTCLTMCPLCLHAQSRGRTQRKKEWNGKTRACLSLDLAHKA
uniref:THAP-type domain-containing protein n=1 Tax=Oryzias latipes TaxID=8090 RepID=H2MH09_ORYLA